MNLSTLVACFVLAQLPTAQDLTSFEQAPAGAFTSVATELGTLRARKGNAVIHRAHARTGKQSLRLVGGEECAVELSFADKREIAEVSFWAERWTRRAPFAFTVEAHGSKGWFEVYEGSEKLRVGARFLTDVRFRVGAEIDGLRFRCTSPADTGVMIDDLEFVTPGPVTLESIEVVHPTLPVLVGNPWNPVARVDLTVAGTEGTLALSKVVLDLVGTTDVGVLDRVGLFRGPEALDYRDPRSALGQAESFGAFTLARTGKLVFEDEYALPRGKTHLWVAVALAEEPNFEARVIATCSAIEIDGETQVPLERGGAPQRLGVALRSHDDDGSHAFRIPGLDTTNEGTLIAVYDVRWHGWGDLPGDIDVGLSRSTDGGRTWEPQRVVMDLGGADSADWRGDGVGDPALLVDRITNTIYVIATWSHGNRAWNGSGPGLEPEETGQLLLVESRDDGRTWSAPRNLTSEVKDPAWSYLLQGPGRGITMHDGTLVFPAQFQASPDENRVPHSTVLVSRDHGANWEIGAAPVSNTTESAVVELQDGVLMLNMRDNRGGSRAVHVSPDLGRTWKEHPTSRSALIEPVCMASLIHVGRELGGPADGQLLFSNPNVSSAPRRRMTIQSSGDFGTTWSTSVLLDEGSSAGYSCLTMVDAKTVGILYEGSRAHMTFQRVPLAELFPAPPVEDAR